MLSCTSTFVLCVLFIFLILAIPGGFGTKKDDKKDKKSDEKDKWKKKDVRDYSDADLERLFDQWEVCELAPFVRKHNCTHLSTRNSQDNNFATTTSFLNPQMDNLALGNSGTDR